MGSRYATMCKLDGWWGPAMKHGKLSLILCDELDGWDDGIGRRLREEGTYVYKWLIDYME